MTPSLKSKLVKRLRELAVGILAFTFRDGVSDVTVQPEWIR